MHPTLQDLCLPITFPWLSPGGKIPCFHKESESMIITQNVKDNGKEGRSPAVTSTKLGFLEAKARKGNDASQLFFI